MNTQTVSLNLSKAKAVGQIARIGQADSEGTTIEAHVYDGATPADLTGATATFCMRLPDGTHFVEDGNCTISGSVVTYVVDEEHCAVVEGYTDEAYFRIDKGGSIYSTARFRVKVFRAASSGASVPESYSSEVEELIDELDDAIETATDAASEANAAAANANATADGVESRVQEMAQDAAETATADAEQRIQDAIDAMGDISELAVPLMSKDTRGGAKLEQHGGLVLRDEKLGIGSLVQQSDGAVRGGIAGLTAEGHAEQFSTTGKNLLKVINGGELARGVSYTYNNDSSVSFTGTATSSSTKWLTSVTKAWDASGAIDIDIKSGETYTASIGDDVGNADDRCTIDFQFFNTSQSTTSLAFVVGTTFVDRSVTFVASSDADKVLAYIRVPTGITVNGTAHPQVELGSTATEYEPYTGGSPSPSPEFPQTIEVVSGHTVTGKTGRFVDLEVRDANDQLLSTTPIPLPSRGWAAGLPEGDVDTLTLDGAGKVTWECKVSETVISSVSNADFAWPTDAPNFFVARNCFQHKFDGFSYKSRWYGDNFVNYFSASEMSAGRANGIYAFSLGSFKNVYFNIPNVTTLEQANAFFSTHPVTILYPLATPVTEDCGYINPPEIPSEAIVSIRELDNLGIKYFIDDSISEYGRQMLQRARSEYADRLQALESAVADLVTGV